MDVLFTAQGMLTIAVIALLLFGPDKLPEMARLFGKFMAEFKRAQQAMETTIQAEMYQSRTGREASPSAVEPVTPVTPANEPDDDEEEEE
jgi:sec-independent protein translocase protein TatA